MKRVIETNTGFTARSDQPGLAHVGVIALVPDWWQDTWQPRHQVMTRLSQYFHVVWCNPAPSWRKFGLSEESSWQGLPYGNSIISSGLTVYHPERWLPTIGRPRILAHWTMRERLRRAQRTLLNRGCRKVILYLWRPEFASALDLIDCDLSCYHIDDEYTFSKVEKPISEHEMELLLRVNQVFIHSTALLEKKGHLNPHTTLVPNGVDYQAYATPCSEPEDMKPIPHPRIGYVGVIKMQLDLALVITLAKRHPQWSLVFVGPQRNKREIAAWLNQLKKLPNVFLLGPKAVRALPGYTQHMDVCMLCYELNDYTKFIYPLKLHEYLASGRPVVGSPIRSLQEFSHVVKLARTADEWSQAIQDSLSPNHTSAAQVRERQRAAQEYDWNHLVKTIAFTLGERLGPSYIEQLRGINFLNNEP